MGFVHIHAATVVAIGDGGARDRTAFEGDQDPVLGALAPALTSDFMGEIAGQDHFGLRVEPLEGVAPPTIKPKFGAPT